MSFNEMLHSIKASSRDGGVSYFTIILGTLTLMAIVTMVVLGLSK